MCRAVRRYGRDAKVVHFLGKMKPWNYSYDAQTGEVKGHCLSPDQCHLHPDYLLMWWRLYAQSVQPLLQQTYGDAPFDSGFADASAEVRLAAVVFKVCVALFLVEMFRHKQRGVIIGRVLKTNYKRKFYCGESFFFLI